MTGGRFDLASDGQGMHVVMTANEPFFRVWFLCSFCSCVLSLLLVCCVSLLTHTSYGPSGARVLRGLADSPRASRERNLPEPFACFSLARAGFLRRRGGKD